MVPDSRRSTTESRFYCTKKTHKPTILVKNKVTKTNQKRACEEGEIDGAEIQRKTFKILSVPANPEISKFELTTPGPGLASFYSWQQIILLHENS